MDDGPRSSLSRLILSCALLAACLMVTVLVVKVPHTFMACILIPSPFLFLFGIWGGYRGLAQGLDAARGDELRTGEGPTSSSLHERAFILAMFGIFGIAISLIMGVTLGHLSAH
jgi:hypothetical protein